MELRKIGKYKIIKKLGQGALTTVFLVESPERQKYALKVLHGISTPKDVKQLTREGKIGRRLFDPSIAQVDKYEFDDPYHYLVMEYVPEQDLGALLRKEGKLKIENAIRISWKVCRALEHAHKQGIIHHDIKPENIIVTRHYDAKVTDFGLAHIASTSISSLSGAHGFGTIRYSAPEKIKGEKKEKRSDLYSLGIVMYQMVTGRLPFDAETLENFVYKHLNEEPERPSVFRKDIPKDLERLILKAMHKSPSDRFQTAGEMRQAIELIAKKMDLALQEIHVPTSVYFKNTLFYWPLERIREVVTNIGANIVGWILTIVFGVLLFVSGIDRLPDPVTLVSEKLEEIYPDLKSIEWFFNWIIPLIIIVGIAISLDVYRRRKSFDTTNATSRFSSALASLKDISSTLAQTAYYHGRWIILSILAVVFFIVFTYFDFSGTALWVLILFASLMFLFAISLIVIELSKDLENEKRLDVIIQFSVFAVLFFAQLFLLQTENISKLFSGEFVTPSEVQTIESPTILNDSQSSGTDEDALISFKNGDNAAQSTLSLFIVLFAIGAMMVSEHKLLGLVMGAIGGGIVGSLFGAVIGFAVEFGKNLPTIFP